MTEYAYHCSPNGDIEEFKPQVSSHGKPLVYATPNKSLALVFGIPEHNDYIINPVYDAKSNSYIFVEMQPEALTKYYRGKSAYLYTVNKDDFTETTGWPGEICSSKEVKPLSVEFIEDLEQAILDEQKEGRLQIISYDRRNDNGYNIDEFFAYREMRNIFVKKQDAAHNIKHLMTLPNEYIFSIFQEQVNHLCQLFDSSCNISQPRSETAFFPKFLEKCKIDANDEIVRDVFRQIIDFDEYKQQIAITELKSTNNEELLQKILTPLKEVKKIISMNMSESILYKFVTDDDEQNYAKQIKTLKRTENKEVLIELKQTLKSYLGEFNQDVEPLGEDKIIPPKFIDRYKSDSSAESINDIFYNLQYVPVSKRIQAIGEIKATGNRELIKKIVFRLTKLHNNIEKDTKLTIAKSKDRE